MEKQEHKSKWDDLARELGAEVSAETQQREQAIATTPAGMSPESRRPAEATTVSPPAPRRAASDWDKLAGDLGVAPAAPLERPVEQKQAPPKKESRPPAAERPPRSSGERREPRERRGEARGKHRERSGRPREERPTQAPPREDSERPVTSEIEAPGATSPRPAEEPAKPASVSLWHKIFGMPAEQSAKLNQPPATAREPEQRLSRDEPKVSTEVETVRSFSGTEVNAAGLVEELDEGDQAALAADEDAPAERKRGRTRRRRRGGRGRKPGERTDEARRPAPHGAERREPHDVAGDDFDDLDVAASDDTQGDEFVDDEPLDEESLNGAEVDGRDSTRGKNAQRTIPSWDEAIGFIVDSNMQNRSQRRASSRSSAPRGRSRGRRRS